MGDKPTDSPADHAGGAADARISPDASSIHGRPPGTANKPRRKPGRKPGSPKPPGSGRKSGSRNVASSTAKQQSRDILNANAGREMTRWARSSVLGGGAY